MITAAAVLALHAGVLTVGPQGAFRTINEAIRAAAPGDTVRVAAAVYHERLVVDRPVVLLGEAGAVIDGGGRGTVLTLTAAATVRGLTIRGSGADQTRQDAGLFATKVHGLVIEDNRFEDVLFGILLNGCNDALIRRNAILGKDVVMPFRGDGIHLWYSHRGRVEANAVTRARDVVIWFSDSTEVRDNVVRDSRYGLHYMNSDHNRFVRNRFYGNYVGAFIMYSDDVEFRDNVFAESRGLDGRGLGFKDADHVVAEGNVLVKNAVGLSLDNSPSSSGIVNVFRNNVVAFNDVAVTMLPSVHANVFHGNTFRDNVQLVSVSGGGTALGNTWRGNSWTEYVGFDADRDGRGDTPFVHERLSDDLLARHPELQFLNLSPATAALNVLSRVFPLLAPQAIVVDSLPATVPLPAAHAGGGSPLAAAALFGIAVAAAATVPLLRRSVRSAR